MASFLAGLLVSAGMDVTLTDEWIEGLQIIRRDGIRLETGNKTVQTPVKTLFPQEETESFLYALVLLKTWQTDWAAASLKGRLQPNATVLTLQNGLGNDSILKKDWPVEKVISGITTLGATLMTPGHVRAFNQGVISLEDKPAAGAFKDLFCQAGLDCKLEKDIQNKVWGKLMINAAINPLTAIFEQPNGWLLENPQADIIIQQIIKETTLLCTTLNITLPYDDPFEEIKRVAKNTSSNISSMLQDLRRLAPTEINRINGAIVNLGKANGIPTPVNQTLTSLVKIKLQTMKRGIK